MLAELVNVGTINGLGEAQGSIDNTRVESKEVLRNLAGTGVLGVERGNENRLVAVVVELEVDGALGEDGAFELVEVAGDFRVLAGLDEPVLEHVAELEVLAFDERQELGGAWVHVGRVDAAGVEETDSSADAEVGPDGEAVNGVGRMLV